MLIPDHETAVDFLNYEAVSTTVVELLRSNRQHALTIGIHGDWGAGKSSILKMIHGQMAKDPKVACLWFNGWAFQGFDDAKTVLIEATITELARQKSGIAKVRELSARLLKRIDWLKVARRGTGIAINLATGLPSPDQINTTIAAIKGLASNAGSLPPGELEAKIEEAASFLKPGEERSTPEEIHKFRDEFVKLLEEAEIDQLVVLIDDLDRCLPATVIDTLEAIRLFLFVPKTAFVIGADEGMVEYAVRQHFPNLPITGAVPYTRNYLEKLIQIPFRVPALGVQEARSYVTLLMVEALVGDDHAGFKTLLGNARAALNRPWLSAGLSQTDVRAVDPARQAELDAVFVVAQQIGSILAEGTRGNPRQVKRFLNSLFIRQTIARARGFADSVNQAVLAKVMLAERFQPDFYEHLASAAMLAGEGKVDELRAMERAAREPAKLAGRSTKTVEKPDAAVQHPDSEKWLERDWIQRWLRIEPAIGAIDLRPYVFVARDRRTLATASEVGGFDTLIETLGGSELAVRSVEAQVKVLAPGDAELIFSALRERVLRHGTFATEPPGFNGLMIVAKHHPRHQSELIGLLASIEVKMLGIWITRGWNEILTDGAAAEEFRRLLTRWAAQDENKLLKAAAAQSVGTPRRG